MLREVTLCVGRGEKIVVLEMRENPPPGVERERTPQGQRAVKKQIVSLPTLL